MKKILLLLLLLPFITLGQINTFPWVHNFENIVGLEQDTTNDRDWWLMQGPTGSQLTGPQGDHTTGSGIYYYAEASTNGIGFPNQTFITYTPTFDISQTPGKVLSFWYHMYGSTMGDLEAGYIDANGYTTLGIISGNQGDQWRFAYYPITATDSFKIVFTATTGSSFYSDICIDDIMVSDPFTVIYGCTDSVSSNYNPLATHSDGSCIYYFGCIDPTATNYNPWANVDDGSCVQNVVCNPGQSLLDVAIKLDNWPSETSWDITANGNVIYSVASGTYDYTQTGQTVHTQVCIPVSDTIIFTINDTYGDGIGGGSVVGSCLVTNIDCEDTVFLLSPSNFGYTASSNPYVSDTCNNDTVIYGCTNPSYIEYDSLATDDDGSCMTLATYGCTDPVAFNYDPTADRMLLTSPCTYDLILYDDGGDSWGACWLGVEQGDSLWQFKITQNNIYSDTFELTLNSYDEVYFYYFEIPTPQQNPQQLDIQTIQNSFKVENNFGTIVYEGNNPWPGPNENKLRNYRSALDIYEAQPYCGNECIPVVTGCMDSIAYNYNELANTNDTCYYNPGCTNPGYLQYYTQGFTADIDDGSCIDLAVFGCTDNTAFNYDSTANVDNGGCIPVVLGCMNPLAFNYNAQANTPDTCIPIIYGCTSPIAFNYDSLANTDDGSCIEIIEGCTNELAFNYNEEANWDNGSCEAVVIGCMDSIAYNYNIDANTDGGGCIYLGCTDEAACNYDAIANADSGGCVYSDEYYDCNDNCLADDDEDGICNELEVPGCTIVSSINYNPEATDNDGSCVAVVYGCTDETSLNYNPLANTDNGSCIEIVEGCTNVESFNYNALANVDDGSCTDVVIGCMDNTMFNYDPNANTDSGNCEPIVIGCMNDTMWNYNPLANTDSGWCIPFIYGCNDETALNFDIMVNTLDNTCCYIGGCMDSTALNYDELACYDDGSCIVIIEGCADPNAHNYDPLVNLPDNTVCLYDAGCIGDPGEPYWLNDPCYAWVIEVDDYCCDVEWDSVCDSMYDYCGDGWPIDARRFLDNDIVIYPNPTKDVLIIETRLDINVEMYNMTGGVINVDNNKKIDLSNYPDGIYNLIIRYDKIVINKKIIKQ